MLALLIVATLTLPLQGKSTPAAPLPATSAPLQDPLQAEFHALTDEFSAARLAYDKRLDELRKSADSNPAYRPEHPALPFWPRFEGLAQRGSIGARLWLAMLFPSAHPGLDEVERDKAWRGHMLVAVLASADTASARDMVRALTVLYLDAPPALVDEAVEAFVKQTTQRECAAEALYRASIAKQRGVAALASPKAAEFGTRLLAEYADSLAARHARGEPEVGFAIGNLAPEFTAKDADGVSFKLSDYRGKVVVLDFWGYW